MIINSVIAQGGIQPSGTINISQNGIVDVTNYASADVQVPTTAPAHYIEYPVDANGTMTRPTTIMNFDGVKTIGSQTLYYAFAGNTNISGIVEFNNLIQIIGSNAMYYAFNGCTGITAVKMPQLVSANGGLTRVFDGCTSLTVFEIPSLKYIGGGIFNNVIRGCTALTDVYFSATTNNSFQASSLANMCTNCVNITLHFPSNVQATVEALSGYSTTAPFSATSGTVLFDLPSTAHLVGSNSVEYERSPKDDTSTALAWRVKDGGTSDDPIIDWTPFYTSGTTDPQVSDTIYSDSACTTAVTTISSIA